MKRIVLILCLLVLIVAFVTNAQDSGKTSAIANSLPQSQLIGDWSGTFSEEAPHPHPNLHIITANDGSLTATMDIPEKGITNIPVSTITFKDSMFNLSVISIQGTYAAIVNKDFTEITGIWSQGRPLELIFRRVPSGASVISTPITQKSSAPANSTCHKSKIISGQATLADVLDCTSELIGPPPEGYTTPFFVVTVTPYESGGTCSLVVATNGMLYSLRINTDYGFCSHLPALHSNVWGRVHHSKFRALINTTQNSEDVPTELIDLVYVNGPKPKAEKYYINTAEAIGPDWGK